MNLSNDLRRVFRDSIRAYFAPLTGAVKGIRVELHRVDRQAQRDRDRQDKQVRQRAA